MQMDEKGRERLWSDYSRTKSSELREKLILEYAPLVKIVAGRLSMYLGYNVEYDDLVSYGIFGLIDAIDKYDLNKQNKFETYASLRIRGEILDQMDCASETEADRYCDKGDRIINRQERE